jgi:transcriptional regulator with XRE-family HTH domain
VDGAIVDDDLGFTSPRRRRSRLIRRAREASGLTQRELGERVGLPQSSISGIETGDAELDPALLPRVAVELEIQGSALRTLMAGGPDDQWRHWIWACRRPPTEKLVLLAVLDSGDSGIALDDLVACTGLTVGTVRAVVDGVVRDGVLRRCRDGRRSEWLIFVDEPSEDLG